LRLKNVEITGFKSFAKRTRLIFSDGISVVVGPNGVGKSNICDAFKWVLGERSTKSLRVDDTRSVLFDGAEKNPPAHVAEVKLEIDNTDRSLPLDLDVVQIKRILRDESGSEYYLNGEPVTLKTISDLFTGTGIGREGYWMIQQNEVGKLTDARPEDRRLLFEEAAGIGLFQQQKKSSLIELIETRNNLNNLNTALSNAKTMAERYREEAQQAELFEEKTRALKAAQIKLLAHEYIDADERLHSLTDKIKAKKQHIDKLKEQRDGLKHQEKKLNETIYNAHKNQSNLKARAAEIAEQINSQEEHISIYVKQLEYHNKTLNDSSKELTEYKQQHDTLTDQIQQSDEHINKLTVEYDKYKKEIESNIKEHAALQNNVRNSQQEVRKLKEEQNTIEQTLHELQEQVDAVIKEFIIELESKQSALQESSDERTKLQETVHTEFTELTHLFKKAKNDIALIDDAIKKLHMLRTYVEQLTIKHEQLFDVIFNQEGIHGRKTSLDLQINIHRKRMAEIMEHIELLENNTLSWQESMRRLQERSSQLKTAIEVKKTELSNNKNNRQRLILDLQTITKKHTQKTNSHDELESTIKTLRTNITHAKDKIASLKKELHNQQKSLQDHDGSLTKYQSQIAQIQTRLEKIDTEIEDHNQKRQKLDNTYHELSVMKENFARQLYDDLDVDIIANQKQYKKISNTRSINDKIRGLKKERDAMGTINSNAPLDYKLARERVDDLTTQKNDIEKSIDDLNAIITHADKESKRLFLDTFSQINTNYSKVCRRLFGGGRAELILTNPDDPLSGGVDFAIQLPGKKKKSLKRLSGGEKTLSIVALLFAVFLSNPSPFCILDEIDAPLDPINTRQFNDMIHEFARGTQFVLITHNQYTMNNADILYGVYEDKDTLPGITQVVSLKPGKVSEFKEKYLNKQQEKQSISKTETDHSSLSSHDTITAPQFQTGNEPQKKQHVRIEDNSVVNNQSKTDTSHKKEASHEKQVPQKQQVHDTSEPEPQSS